MGPCAFDIDTFGLVACLQLEAVWASMHNSTTKVTKPLRLVLFLTYKMSRFLGFGVT